MAANSFATKQLRVTFTLSNGAVFENANASDTLVLSGLKTIAKVKGSGFPAWPEADVSIYGMKQSDMNALSSLAFNLDSVTRNTMQVDANSGNGWSTVYVGQIVNAFIDYSDAPEVPMRVTSRALYLESINPASPSSFPGATSVAQIVQTLAAQAGYQFFNAGVTSQVSNPYLAGTATDQINQIVKAAGCEFYVDNNLLVICPVGQPRTDVPSFTLSPASGLVGYPVADARGYLNTRALYNPAFRFGGPVTVAGSDVVIAPAGTAQVLNDRANGNWYVGAISHTLEAVKFGGAWFTDMLLQPLGTQPSAS